MTKRELMEKRISVIKADILLKESRVDYYKAQIEYIDEHPDEFYTGSAKIKALTLQINSLLFNIYELQTELFTAQKDLNTLLSQRGDVKDELEDHKTVSEE